MVEHILIKLHYMNGNLLYDGQFQNNMRNGIGKSYYINGKSAFATHSIAFVNFKSLKCKYLYYYLNTFRIELMKKAKYGSGLGHISLLDIKNFKVIVPSLEHQEEIINKIEKLNEHNSHYESYSNMLKTEINNIMEIINNMTILSNNNKSDKDESDNDKSDNEESDNDKYDEESDEESVKESDEESDNEIQEIEYKNKLYHLIDDKIYHINDDGKTGKIFANYINNKIKKI